MISAISLYKFDHDTISNIGQNYDQYSMLQRAFDNYDRGYVGCSKLYNLSNPWNSFSAITSTSRTLLWLRLTYKRNAYKVEDYIEYSHCKISDYNFRRKGD